MRIFPLCCRCNKHRGAGFAAQDFHRRAAKLPERRASGILRVRSTELSARLSGTYPSSPRILFFFCGSLGGGHIHRLNLHPQVELFEREQRRLKEVQSRVERTARAKFLFFQLVASSREKCKARTNKKTPFFFRGFSFQLSLFRHYKSLASLYLMNLCFLPPF
jgi:hypothetical protein